MADKVLDYLGRYVHRTALSGKAVVAQDDKTVTFVYRRSGQSARPATTLPAEEFLRRFLQHVPPKGLHRVRAFRCWISGRPYDESTCLSALQKRHVPLLQFAAKAES